MMPLFLACRAEHASDWGAGKKPLLSPAGQPAITVPPMPRWPKPKENTSAACLSFLGDLSIREQCRRGLISKSYQKAFFHQHLAAKLR